MIDAWVMTNNFSKMITDDLRFMIDSDDIPPPPEPPEDYECCDNGCDELCVFEIYRLQKADYDKKYAHKIEKADE